jgi:hypothetical protein
VSAPRALGFRAATDARYRRTYVFWTPPVADVLRTLPRPLRIEQRVYVDARTLRLVTAAAPRHSSAAHRVEQVAAPMLTRLVGRATRDDADAPNDRHRAVVVREAAAGRVERRRREAAAPVPPVAMVLARTAAAAGAIASTAAVTASSGWPSGPAGHARGPAKASADNAPGLSTLDVNHLTERVVAAIDRRMLAVRERLGR